MIINDRPQGLFIIFISHLIYYIFPSRISGRGYGIGPVCLWVCVSVSQSSHGWNDLDIISAKFKGQGHQVIKSNFQCFKWVDLCRFMSHDVIWHHGVMSRRHDFTWRHSVMSWLPVMTFGQENWQRVHVAGGRVNAQAFSSYLKKLPWNKSPRNLFCYM